MPTGYTAGILDGEIKDFKQFAKLCIRNFGATIHMRDEPMDMEYVPRTPSDYHTKAIAEANKLLSDSQQLPDEEVIGLRKEQLLKDKKYYLEAIEKAKKNTEKLNVFLKEATEYTPPTDQHNSVKDFMINQINLTIDGDCNTSYYAEKLLDIENELSTLNPQTVRLSMLEKAVKDLRYHENEYAQELKRSNESNEWVRRFMESIDSHQ